MMLDLTLLKVKHAGEKEARKLLPYVGLCDAFSPESATLTERDAKLAEEEWRRFLKSMSHKRFIRNTTEILNTLSEWEIIYFVHQSRL
jgi:hypothetical protein